MPSGLIFKILFSGPLLLISFNLLITYLNKNKTEAGCDEAGRGCLAGPVFAAAVILPKDFKHPLLNDSKQMKESHREKMRLIIEKEAIAFSVAKCDHDEIDKINILNASFLAMHRALDNLKESFNSILVDGNRFKKYKNIKHHCIVKGDSKYASIAAASVLAKTHRDELMRELHKEFPQYGWNRNKAYATQFHRDAVLKFGNSPLHRKTFKLHLQYEMDF